MAAANTDLFRKTKARFSTTLASGISSSDTTIPCSDLTGVPTDTAVTISLERVDSNGNATPDNYEAAVGVVSGNNIINAVRGIEGTAQSHAAGKTVEILWNADTWNDAVDGILTEHNQDGTHKKVTNLDNNTPITQQDSGGTARDIANINASDVLTLGTTAGSVVTGVATTAKASVYLNANQSITANTLTTVQFANEFFDPGSNFDTSTYQFTAPVAGKYRYHFSIPFGVTADLDRCEVYVYKNGAIFRKYQQQASGTVTFAIAASGLIDLAASDTVDIRVKNVSNNDVIVGSAAGNDAYFDIALDSLD